MFISGFVNNITRNIEELYYFIPIAVSAIFSFMIFPAALVILDLVYCTKISGIEKARKDFNKIRCSNNAIEINEIYFYSFMFLLFGVFMFLVLIASLENFIFKINNCSISEFLILYLLVVVIPPGLVFAGLSNKNKYNKRIGLKNQNIYLSWIYGFIFVFMFVSLCFFIFIFVYLNFVEVFVAPCIGLANIDSSIIERMREMLILLPIK